MKQIYRQVLQTYQNHQPQLMKKTVVFSGCRFIVEDECAQQWETFAHYQLQEDSFYDFNFEWRLIHLRDTVLYRAIMNEAERNEPKQRIETFKEGTYHRCFFDEENGTKITYFITENDDHYIVIRVGNSLFYVITADFTKQAETYPLRVIREVVFRTYENQGAIMLHGGGVTDGEHGILICGGKAAGKTTFLFSCLELGFHYLANDRVLMKRNATNYTINSIPIPTRVGLGTIRAFPQLANALANFEWSRPQGSILHNLDQHQQFGSSEKLEMTPQEIKTIMRVHAYSSANLSAIVMPQLNPTVNGFEMTEIPERMACDSLWSQTMTPFDDQWLNPWLVERNGSNEQLSEQAKGLLRHLVKTVPVIKIQFGADYVTAFAEHKHSIQSLMSGR